MKLHENRPAFDTPKKRRFMAIRHALSSHRVEYGEVGTQALVSELQQLEHEGVGQAVRSTLQAIRGK